MIQGHRNQPLWFAYALHRFSGLALAVFLPLHFMMLGQALNGPKALDASLRWTDSLFFKFAEYGLVFFLAVHMFGGLRLMALEWLPWSDRQKSLAAAAVAAAFAVATGFFLTAVST
ncbi:MAG: succinate dehydrogenase [Rhizobiaceae bacterium]